MYKPFTILVAALFCSLSAFAQFQVGHLQQTFTDASRSNRSISTEIYYPANTAGDNVPIATGQFPVLVFGHGFVMAWSAYDVVWNALVPEGYIVIFPTTETSFSPSHTDFGKDIAFLVGAMKAEGANASSTFYNAVDSHSAVMGHSMGGGSAFLAMQYDTTITALATLAAAVTNPSSVTAATLITKPAIVFSGVNDCVAPPAQHQIPMYDSLASDCKTLVSIVGASHCQFASSNFACSFGEATCSPAPTINAATQQSTTFALLLPWLDFYLKNDTTAGNQFQSLIDAGAGITAQQNCTLLTTNIEKINAQHRLSIYPNPFSETTIIQTQSPMNAATLTIYNTLGQTVKSLNNFSGQTITIQREQLPSGIYFISLTENNQVLATQKIVVE